MSLTPAELGRLAAALDRTSRDLAAHTQGHDRAELVRRALEETSLAVTQHAAAARPLEDEIVLARRGRTAPSDLAALQLRRTRETARLRARIDAATTSLVAGGDRLDPVTILRRLTGASPAGRSFFGRPPVDRGARIARLTALLTGGRAAFPDHPQVTPLPPHTPTTRAGRAARLGRLRRHMAARHTPDPGATA